MASSKLQTKTDPPAATPKQAPTSAKATEVKLAAAQVSYDNTNDLEDVSQLQRNFKEAFEATEVPAVSHDGRVG